MIALMPHGSCFFWDPGLTSLHVISDTMVAVAYFSIPIILYKNHHYAAEPIRPILYLFCAFILSCGVGHFLQAWNIWHADYWLEGIWTWLTGAISLYTAWEMKQLIPRFLTTQQDLATTRALIQQDSLTGLANRRGLMTAINSLPTSSGQNSLKHTLAIIDLDGFKGINDTHGHAAGDALLKAVANLLRTKIRSIDSAIRLGGDEFALLLVGCAAHEALNLTENLLQDISKIQLPDLPIASDQPLISASIGVTELPPDNDLDISYKQADQALYEAKRNGKNQIVRFSLEETTERP
jgi:diguanylate cyclase (GGDEF)-like protein